MYKKYYPFPSPIGVLYISIFKENRHGTARRQFPSPIGVLYISMKYLDVAEYVKEKQVSVPYWGSLYFNKGKKTYEEEMTSFRPLLGFFIFQSLSVAHDNNEIIAVSVPYWGSLYFNSND